MRRRLLAILVLAALLAGCSTMGGKGTIAQLRNMRVEIKEEKIEGGLEKAMESYQRFLKETPDSALSPEAIRRLADLKVEKEYGHIGTGPDEEAAAMAAPERAKRPHLADRKPAPASGKTAGESEAEFEKRATGGAPVAAQPVEPGAPLPEGGDDLEKAGPLEAVTLYQKLLKEYPLYERNDQVLYQMSRAYEELGRVEEAMQVMDRMVREYPHSRYMDEVQFRRGEYFFTHRRYLDAEDAYKSIVDMGVGSFYYQLALYKLGWTFYKQELYDEAQHKFIALLDYKVSVGYDFEQTSDEPERKRVEDTFRVISLGFSYLGGADAVVDYFEKTGKRAYEDRVYQNLAEFYFDKRRYSDAGATYNAFVTRNPYHAKAPLFHMRVIDVNIAGGFPSLVIESKKTFCSNYGLKGDYWKYFEPAKRPEVLEFLKTNLKDLANHYHALYQDKRFAKDRPTNFTEGLHWYREYLASFPQDAESPVINYQLADLLLENRNFEEAAREYEKTAYDYPLHEKSATAGYAAVYAFRQHLSVVREVDRNPVKREVVRSSLKFADTFPEHEKAAIVLGAAVDDLYAMEDFLQAQATGRKLVDKFPKAAKEVRRGAWLVVGHSSFELKQYPEAEAAYVQVLALLPPDDKTRPALVDNLAASIYKQGELANAANDYRAASDHFLRVGAMAPGSKFRATAEYDAAAALIQLADWKKAATVLTGFRELFPGHELQPEVTKKIAHVYRQDGQLSLAAKEYERIERESKDEGLRREALLMAAELYEEAEDRVQALAVYRRYVGYFQKPLEPNLETRNKIAEILKAREERDNYLAELRQIVSLEGAAKPEERTVRTRFLAGTAALVLAELSFDRFAEVQLVKPFEANLRKKKELMKTATQEFGRLLDYEVGEVTAAATYYLAEIYAHFSKALMGSERPEGLSELELEQYELAIEEQAYPFEEKAIAVHQSNMELIALGVYNTWIDKSLQKLAKFVPARYAKPEAETGVVASLETYLYEIERQPAPQEQGAAAAGGAVPAAEADHGPAPAPEEGAVQRAVQPQEIPPSADVTVGADQEPAPAPEEGAVQGTAQPREIAPSADVTVGAEQEPAPAPEEGAVQGTAQPREIPPSQEATVGADQAAPHSGEDAAQEPLPAGTTP